MQLVKPFQKQKNVEKHCIQLIGLLCDVRGETGIRNRFRRQLPPHPFESKPVSVKPVFIETGLARSLKPVSDDTETGFVQLVKPVSETEKRPNTEPQGVPEALDRFFGESSFNFLEFQSIDNG